MKLKDLRKKLAEVIDREGDEAGELDAVYDSGFLETILDVEVRDEIKLVKKAGETGPDSEVQVRVVVLS